MVRIRVIQESEARDDLKAAYEDIREIFGFVPDVFKLLSARPDLLRLTVEQYRAMFLAGVVPRPIKEIIGTVVARTISCNYCTKAHSTLLQVLGGTHEAALAAEDADIDRLPVEEKYRSLLRACVKLTLHAYKVTDADIDGLRADGLSDEEIIEGLYIASAFNQLPRLADAFGLYELGQLMDVPARAWPRREDPSVARHQGATRSQLVEGRADGLDTRLDDRPDHVRIDRIVVADQAVAERHDLGEVGDSLLKAGVERTRSRERFAEDRELPFDRRAYEVVSHVLFERALGRETQDPIARLYRVVQEDADVTMLHTT